MNLTPSDITAILAGTERNVRSTGSYAILDTGERIPLRTSEVGKYEGRAGTMRRSRKGRTYRAPNGSRFYVNGDPTVVAYKV